MIAIRLVLAKACALFRIGRPDADLAEDLSAHMEMLAGDLERQGLSPGEARRQARLRLGGADQVIEAARDQRSLPWVEQIWRDVRLAVRSLSRSPLFAVTAMGTLAVGVAANTVGFGILYGFLIRPLPFTDGSRLVSVLAAAPARGIDRRGVSLQDLQDIRRRSRSFDGVAATGVRSVDLTGRGEPRRLMASLISPELHAMVGIRPIVGRLFLPAGERPASDPEVLIGEGLWRAAFGADVGVVGQSVLLSGRPYVVVGVLPAQPTWNANADLVLSLGPAERTDPRAPAYRLVAHLSPGSTVESANRELEVLSSALATEYPDDHTGIRLFAEDLRTDLLDDNRGPALVFYGVVSLLLLLACANVATLMVMRSTSRTREFAIRASLGAGRFQIVRQVLVEHAVVTLAGGTLGALLGAWVQRLLPTASMSTTFRFDLDATGFALLAAIVLASAFLFGAVSAWAVGRQAFDAPHRSGRDTTGGPDRARLRHGLAVFEVAAAVLVLVGTGLLLKGALRVASAAPGFDVHNVLTMEINLPEVERYQDPARTVRFFRELVERVRALPRVESVSAGNPPLYLGWEVAYEAEMAAAVREAERPRTMDAVVMPGYFQTLRIPLVDGRDFTERDSRSDSPPVVVVSQAFAQATWPGQRAVGRRIRLHGRGGPAPSWREVIGVVGDARVSTFAPPRGWVYLPHGQPPYTELVLMIRFSKDAGAVIRDVRRLVWEVEPSLPVHWNALLSDLIAERYWQPRAYSVLSSVFSAIALVVALVGVYGVVAYASARRTREFGIRLAVGAPSSGVWALVIGHGVRLALIGTAVGMLAALGVMRLASTVFFGVSPTDAWVYAICGALALAAVVAASAAPAFRAARLDPVAVLRCEQ